MWYKQGGLQRLLLSLGIGFLGLRLVQTGLVLAGQGAAYAALVQALSLPGTWGALLLQPWALITHAWVHTAFWHTAWGLLVLYTLGQVVVDRLSARHLWGLYVLGSVAGGLAYVLLHSLSPHWRGQAGWLSGFAGGLYGVMVAATTLSPRRPFYLLLWGPFKLWHLVGLLLLLEVSHLTTSAASVAHLGGALWGYVYIRWLLGAYGWASTARWWRTSLRVRRFGHRPRTKAAPQPAHIDALLDKVAASGYGSLTPDEQRQLFEAGRS